MIWALVIGGVLLAALLLLVYLTPEDPRVKRP